MEDHSCHRAFQLPGIFALRVPASFLMRVGDDAIHAVRLATDVFPVSPLFPQQHGSEQFEVAITAMNGADPDVPVFALVSKKRPPAFVAEKYSVAGVLVAYSYAEPSKSETKL